MYLLLKIKPWLLIIKKLQLSSFSKYFNTYAFSHTNIPTLFSKFKITDLDFIELLKENKSIEYMNHMSKVCVYLIIIEMK